MNMCMPRINPSYHQSNNDYKTRTKQNTTKSHEYATEYAVNTSESYLWMINDTQPILFLRVRRANFNCLTSLLRSSNQPSFQHPVHHHLINTSRPRQNGQCYANDIFTRVTYNKTFEFQINLDGGLAPNRRQSIICMNYGLFYWCTNASLGPN